MKYTEDDLTESLIKHHREPSDLKKVLDLETECHYNNYGSRGYVDLVIKEKETKGLRKESSLHLYEVKSDLTQYSANEINRQFTKMYENFIAGSSFQGADNPTIELTIIPSEENFEWLCENKVIIRNIFEKYEHSIVTFRHPENISPVHIFASDSHDIDTDDFWDHAESNQKVMESIKGVTSHE